MNTGVILSDQRESKNLRIIWTSKQKFGAKILRFASLTQDDTLFFGNYAAN